MSATTKDMNTATAIVVSSDSASVTTTIEGGSTGEGGCSLCEEANKNWQGFGRAECEGCDRRYGPECTNCMDVNGNACQKIMGAVFLILIAVIGFALAYIGCAEQSDAAVRRGMLASCSPIGNFKSIGAFVMAVVLVPVGIRYLWLVGLNCTCRSKSLRKHKGDEMHRICAWFTVFITVAAGALIVLSTFVLWFQDKPIPPDLIVCWFIVAFSLVAVGSGSCLFRRPLTRPCSCGCRLTPQNKKQQPLEGRRLPNANKLNAIVVAANSSSSPNMPVASAPVQQYVALDSITPNHPAVLVIPAGSHQYPMLTKTNNTTTAVAQSTSATSTSSVGSSASAVGAAVTPDVTLVTPIAINDPSGPIGNAGVVASHSLTPAAAEVTTVPGQVSS